MQTLIVGNPNEPWGDWTRDGINNACQRYMSGHSVAPAILRRGDKTLILLCVFTLGDRKLYADVAGNGGDVKRGDVIEWP